MVHTREDALLTATQLGGPTFGDVKRLGSSPIALVLSGDGTAVGGVTRVAIALSGKLEASGWQVTPVFPASTDNKAALMAWATSAGVHPVVSTDWLSIQHGRSRNFAALVAHCRQAKADVVHLHYGGTHIPLKDVIAVVLGARLRPIVSLHAPVPWGEQPRFRALTTRLAARLTRSISPCCSAVADLLQEAGVSASQISVVHGGVELPKEGPSKSDSRSALRIPSSAFVVGTVVRLAPEKAVPDLVRAVANLPLGPNEPFLLVKGDNGVCRPEVEALLRELLPGRHRLLGVEANNDQVYAASDVFGLSSTSEGFPLVLLEAAARRLPVVSTDVGSVRDFISNGVNGFMVPPRHCGAFSDALSILQNNPVLRETMGTEGRRRVEESFTVDAMVRGYLAEYPSSEASTRS